MTGTLTATLSALAGQAGGAGGSSSSSPSQPCVVRPSGVQGICTTARSLHIPVEYHSILPQLILLGGALLIMILSSVLPKRQYRGLWSTLTVLIGLASLGASAWLWNRVVGDKKAIITIGNSLNLDGYSVFFMVLASGAVILTALVADSYLRREGLDSPELYILTLVSASGAMIMAEANDLLVIFLGLEILSIALYVLAGYHRRRRESGEAAMKYFVLGSFSSAIFLYGIALVYGATGSTRLDEIASFLAQIHLTKGVLDVGIALLIVGLAFEVSAVPFHTWTPDVYEGAPTPVTGFMAAAAKAAGFAGLIRILISGFPALAVDWRPIIWALAVLTLLVGSILAIVQTNVKRMLAYSAISHAGFVLVGVQAANTTGVAGALFYLLAYMFMVIGAFAVVSIVGGKGEAHNDLESFRGLSSRRAGLALLFTIFLLAQAGVPFTSGFIAKFYVVSAAVDRGQYALAVIAMLAAAIAAFFYLRVGILMYSQPAGAGGAGSAGAAGAAAGSAAGSDGGSAGGSGDAAVGATVAVAAPAETSRITIPVGVGIALAICVAFTVVVGIVPGPVIDFARKATLLF
jgi:NADH-quinone oxidoreductase subunit N